MSLKTRLLVVYVCFGIAVLLIVGTVLFVEVKNSRSADLELEFTNQLKHLDFALADLIEEAKSDVLQLSQNELVRTRDDADFTSFLNANESTFVYNYGETEQSIIDILNAYRTTHSYVNSVYMGRENGTFVRAQPRIPTQYDPRERPWYILAKESSDQVVITAPYQALTTTDVNIGVEKALVDEDGEFYGVAGADITLNDLTEYMSGFEVGYQGQMLLTDGNGTILAFADSELLFQNVEALLGDTAADFMSENQATMANGSTYLYLYTSPSLGWKLAVMVPASAVNHEIQGTVFIALFGLFLALALLVVLAFIGLNMSVIRPLRRLDKVALDITRNGDLSQKTGISSRDEIGTLADSFDHMTDALREKETALKADEAELRRHRDHLQEMVQARTEELKSKAAELEAANKELEAFSYSVSHDLRAPLRTIDGFSQALVEEYKDKIDVQGKDYLQRIRTAAQRMAQLIDDMLKLSRVTRAEMKIGEVNLTQVAWSIVNELRKSDPGRSIEIKIADGLEDSADPNLMRIALENLLGNAWKFTGKRSEAKIEFSSMKKNGETVYFIRDNGAGFDMAYVDKLFAPFQRLHSMEEFPGTGIGLATVQRIMSRHGGKVWAEGQVNKGATVYFTLR